MGLQEYPARLRPLSRRDCLEFELLYLLEIEPGLSQRDISARLDISVGRVNNVLKDLCAKGALTTVSSHSGKSAHSHAYALAPQGLSQRSTLTHLIIARKLAQVEHLTAQIARLRRDATATPLTEQSHQA